MNIKNIVCKVEGCQKKHRANGYCCRHESQIKTKGYIFGNPQQSPRDKNKYIIEGDITKIIIFDRQGYPKCETTIDTTNLEKCKPYKWSVGGGYVSAKIDGKTTRINRHLLNISDSNVLCDHINRDKLDNRLSNLRTCTRAQNVLNVGMKKGNKSGYKGVYKRANRWEVQISINNKRIHIGSYGSAEKAAFAYNIMAQKFHGEFACLNQIRSV